jgi:methyltransferase family protein
MSNVGFERPTASIAVGLLDRITPRKNESDSDVLPTDKEAVFPTKALRKFLACLTAREQPVLVDLGPVVGSNISFFGEQLGCKIFVLDLFADLDRHVRDERLDELSNFLVKRVSQEAASVDGILCWDFMDYLDKSMAQKLAAELTRVLRPEGALLGFFGTLAQPVRDLRYTKFIVADDVNLRYRTYRALRSRQPGIPNRELLRMFAGLRVSDSFLLKNNQQEILFRKSA